MPAKKKRERRSTAPTQPKREPWDDDPPLPPAIPLSATVYRLLVDHGASRTLENIAYQLGDAQRAYARVARIQGLHSAKVQAETLAKAIRAITSEALFLRSNHL